jgi:hypothetical protein
MYNMAKTVGNMTHIKIRKTETGVKDNMLEHFLNKLSASYSKARGVTKKQEALDEFLECIPENPYSPVWRIRGAYFVFNLSLCAD